MSSKTVPKKDTREFERFLVGWVITLIVGIVWGWFLHAQFG